MGRRDEQHSTAQTNTQNQISSTNLTITHTFRVPHFPDEDSKLRATALQVRRGGNCPNSLEVLAQLVAAGPQRLPIKLHMVSCLPGAGTAATRKILASFGDNGNGNGDDDGGDGGGDSSIDFSHCLYREGYEEPASSYIIRSGATGSRTIVNFSELPEMNVGEFEAIADAFSTEHGDECWWHFEVGAGEIKISRDTMDPPFLCFLFCLGVQRGVSCVVLCVVALLLTPKTRADFQRQRSVASATCAGLRREVRSVLRLRSLAGKA